MANVNHYLWLYMTSPITIRQGTLADLDTLLAISKKTFFDAFESLNNPDDFKAYTDIAFTTEKLRYELADPDTQFYFASDADSVVGYIKLNFNDAQTEYRDSNALEVERIYVSADLQGKKIGELLLNFAIAIAKKNNFAYVWLGVWERNLNAIRFYQRHGFVQNGSHPFMIGNDRQTDILMKMAL